MKVKIKRLDGRASLPAYATDHAAALDLRAVLDAPLTLEAGGRAMVPTGLAIEPDSRDSVAIVCARSGLAVKHGITLSNGIGVIDSDYRGEIRVGLVNLSDDPYTIEPDERIAQLMFLNVCRAQIEETDVLEETGRGAGGFGSTGRS